MSATFIDKECLDVCVFICNVCDSRNSSYFMVKAEAGIHWAVVSGQQPRPFITGFMQTQSDTAFPTRGLQVRAILWRIAVGKSVFPLTRGRYHGGRQPSSHDSFHSPTVIPPLALEKPRIMKHYHRRRTCSHTSPRRSPTMVTLHDTRFVECRWWNDGWTVKTVVT